MAGRARADGAWQSVYGLFRAWQLTGTWTAILTDLQATGAEAAQRRPPADR